MINPRRIITGEPQQIFDIMLRQTKDITVYLFSAELSELNKEQNEKRTRRLEAFLTAWNIPYTKVVGSYKGTLEYSFRVQGKHIHPFALEHVFKVYGQESVLYINKRGFGSLLFNDATEILLGKVKDTSIVNAIENLEAFTIYRNKAWYFSNE